MFDLVPTGTCTCTDTSASLLISSVGRASGRQTDGLHRRGGFPSAVIGGSGEAMHGDMVMAAAASVRRSE